MRKVYDYVYNGRMIFRIGYVRYFSAHAPLQLHKHENMVEFVCMQRGAQKYRIGDTEYTVRQGDVFFTCPDELHDTASLPEERSALYYLIVDINRLKERKIFLSAEEDEALTRLVTQKTKRVFKASPALPEAFKLLLNAAGYRDEFSDTRIRNALSHVLITLMTPGNFGVQPAAGVEKSLRYIQAHPDEAIPVEKLAAMEGMSLSTYNRKFVETAGASPGEYIVQQRIERAKELLLSTDLSVTDIAFRYGFSSGQYFATVFMRFCRITPREFRLAHKENKPR